MHGGRHMAFGKGGRFAYAINEILLTVTAFRYDAGRGSLTELQTVAASPETFAGPKSGACCAAAPPAKRRMRANRAAEAAIVAGMRRLICKPL